MVGPVQAVEFAQDRRRGGRDLATSASATSTSTRVPKTKGFLLHLNRRLAAGRNSRASSSPVREAGAPAP